jgi:hypothetical protein
VNTKALIDLITRKASESNESQAPDPFGNITSQKVLASTGIDGLKTLAFKLQVGPDGSMSEFFLGVPEASRQGLFKLLGGEAKDSAVPAFVPADAVKFSRWRMDGQKVWATLDKIIGDISPGVMNLLLGSAESAAKEKDPDFDIKKDLIGNLGDDLISYEKAAQATGDSGAKSTPSLVLLGSPNAEKLTAAVKTVLGALNPQAAPTQREFLGRKIITVTLPALPLPVPDAAGKPPGPRLFSLAASGGYMAMSADAAILEEYLRSSEKPGKALRESVGLADATQRVAGPGTVVFGFENQTETMRTTFDSFKVSTASGTTNANLTAMNLALTSLGMDPQTNFMGWFDFSLLPSFDKVAKYFSFAVYGGKATVDGLSFKVFAPAPPAVRAAK